MTIDEFPMYVGSSFVRTPYENSNLWFSYCNGHNVYHLYSGLSYRESLSNSGPISIEDLFKAPIFQIDIDFVLLNLDAFIKIPPSIRLFCSSDHDFIMPDIE